SGNPQRSKVVFGHAAPRSNDDGLSIFHRSQVSEPRRDIRQGVVSGRERTRRLPAGRLRYDDAAPSESGQASEEGTAREPGNTAYGGRSDEPSLVSVLNRRDVFVDDAHEAVD